jgi:hypothetical protein
MWPRPSSRPGVATKSLQKENARLKGRPGSKDEIFASLSYSRFLKPVDMT